MQFCIILLTFHHSYVIMKTAYSNCWRNCAVFIETYPMSALQTYGYRRIAEQMLCGYIIL